MGPCHEREEKKSPTGHPKSRAVQNAGRREASYRTAGRLGEEIRSSEVSFRDPGVVE